MKKSRSTAKTRDTEPERELDHANNKMNAKDVTIRPGEKKLPQLSLTATAAAAGAVIAFWVVSFPRCVVMHPVGKCEWLGLSVTCLPAIDRKSPWNFLLAHWLLAGVLFTIGVANALRIDTKRNCLTTIATSGYAIVTSSFAIFRAQFGLSKPLLIGAALHNLFEWMFVATVTHATLASKKQFIAKAAAWILLVVFTVALVPDIKIATILEQSVGIMLDFFSSSRTLSSRSRVQTPRCGRSTCSRSSQRPYTSSSRSSRSCLRTSPLARAATLSS